MPEEPPAPASGPQEQPELSQDPEKPADLSAVIDELAQQIKEAHQLTEEEIQQKLSERGNLIGEEKKAVEAIEKGKGQLEYFRTRQELGEFQDEKSKALIVQLGEKVEQARGALEG